MEKTQLRFSRQKFKHVWFVVLFSLLFFIVRIPFFSNPLFFEEGIFADIFINRIHGPQYGQIGRINGEEIYTALQHPGFIYETIAISGQIFQIIVPLKGIPQEVMNFRIRAAFAIFQFLYWLWIIFILALAERKNLKHQFSMALKIVIIILSIMPLAVHSSYILQVDNSVGVLLAGFFAGFLLIWYLDLFRTWTLNVFSFLSGLIWGIGKNEWTILLFLSMLFTFAFLMLRRLLLKEKPPVKTDFVILLFHLVGCICGNILNFLFDPGNYFGGIQLIFERAVATKSGFEEAGGVALWFNTLVFKSPYLFLGIIGSIVLFFICVQRIKVLPAVFVWGASYSFLLFFFFFFASYHTEIRYFIVSYVLQVALFAMAFFMLPLTKRGLFYGRVGLMIIILLAFIHYGQSLRQMSREREQRTTTDMYLYFQYQKEMGEKTGCIPAMDIADAFNNDSLDYLSYTLFYEHSTAIISSYGKQLCMQ